jgi:hypothetical protein
VLSIEIVDYDPQWPAVAAGTIAELERALPDA